MDRSKSANLHRPPLKSNIEANQRYAGMLQPLVNLKYTRVSAELQHRPYMQLAQLLTKYNSILQKETVVSDEAAHKDWSAICEFA